MACRALCVYVQVTCHPVGCRLPAVATDVTAAPAARIILCRPAFRIEAGYNRNIGRLGLVEVFYSVGTEAVMTGNAGARNFGQPVMLVVGPLTVGTGVARWRPAIRRIVMAGATIKQVQGRTGRVAGQTAWARTPT